MSEKRLSAEQLAKALRMAAKKIPPSASLASAALREAATQIVAHLGGDQRRHGAELSRLSAAMALVHPDIEREKAVDAALSLLGVANGDGERVSTSWLWSVGFYRDEDYGGDVGWFSKELGDDTGDWLSVNPDAGVVTIANDNKRDCPSINRPLKTRGQLRRLWFGLTGEGLSTWSD